MLLRLDVNGSVRIVDADPQSPLLWVLRDELNLVGAKYGCGIGQCSACTVHLNGAPVPSCQITAGAAQGQAIRTIDGLARFLRVQTLVLAGNVQHAERAAGNQARHQARVDCGHDRVVHPG